MWYSVRITIRSCHGVHSVTVSQKTFAEIPAGKEMTLQNDGFATEQGVVRDYWEFNAGELKVGLESHEARARRRAVLRLDRASLFAKDHEPFFNAIGHKVTTLHDDFRSAPPSRHTRSAAAH